MASCTQTSKAVLDVQDCIDELGKGFSIAKLPINDDNATLHRLEEKLEFILQLGLKDKNSVFGLKKSYWDYISTCYNSSKRCHLGLKFIKSNLELKTSIGRGRVFIRFCLTQKSLGDTLKVCFIDQKSTRDFYVEGSLPLQPELWSPFITSLYDLNEINFDLNRQYSELDVSLSRKILLSSENEGMVDIKFSSDLFGSGNLEDVEGLKVHESAMTDDFVGMNNNFYYGDNSSNKDNIFLKHINAKLNSKFDYPTTNLHDLIAESPEASCSADTVDSSVKDLPTVKFSRSLTDDTPVLFSVAIKNNTITIDKPASSIEADNNSHYSNPSTNQTSASPISSDMDTVASGFEADSTSCNINPSTNETSPFPAEVSDSFRALFYELKGFFDNVRNSANNSPEGFSCAKQTWDSFETCLFTELKKIRDSNSQEGYLLVYSFWMKMYALQQEVFVDSLVKKMNLIIKDNETLYSKISVLKDKLHSYGLLKIQTENTISLPPSISLPSETFMPWSGIVASFLAYEKAPGFVLQSFDVIRSSLSKLHILGVQATNLQSWVESSHKLNNNLISRVQDQEMHMKGITRELEEARNLLSVMKNQHQKLQSAENIVKYDLQEKRKLLTRLKQQLETTREDSNIVRLKNSKSEVEWKNLRKEFVQRHKQTSEESGFVDDKVLNAKADKEIPVEPHHTTGTDDEKIGLGEVACENMDSYSEACSSISSEIESFHSGSCSNNSLNSTTISRNISLSVDSLKTANTVPSDDIDMFCCQSYSLPDDIISLKNSVPISTEIIDIISSEKTEIIKDSSRSCSEDFPEEKPLSEKESVDMECGNLSQIISELKEDNRNLKYRLQELEEQNKSFYSKMEQQTVIEAAKEHEITALQFQLNSQSLQYEKVLKEFSENNDGLKDMKQKINDQEQFILSLEEALTEIQMERENEKELQWGQLEDFKRYSLEDREAMETEILKLQNYSKELQKKVIKLLKQKDVLWKQNDHLTFVQKIQIDDRWMADHEVSECLGCKSNFSFILRKHHCRHCGRIFCYSCSNNWLLTPSSRKQIRVCNECYMQHMEMKNVVRRDSNPPYFDDESEDEASTGNVSITMDKITSLQSENHPNRRTNSIISLPVMQKSNLETKSHFMSVPDLHSIDKDNEDIENLSSLSQPVLTCDTKASTTGVEGDLIIKAKEEAILPILCEAVSGEIHWSVYPREAIPITLIYEDATHCGKTVLHKSECEVESVIHLSLPGLYNFHFDNRSRATSIVVHHSFKMFTTKEQVMHL